ncbi:hypothetical protein [Actibacterium sp. MT2.3-13A]|uniref:hypothetical protein n=1 Tax=Actibacterium sp. MT2.3-13A TaxID=2828332 RepID=UPI001BA86F2B|nr:hypothetical protein [Actibacterium sp. MT2.3-13A]
MSRRVIQDSAEFRRMWADDMPIAEMAMAYGVSDACISQAARRFGLAMRSGGRAWKITDEAAFRRMWHAGLPVAAIAEHFDASTKSVTQAARRYGLPPRRSRGPRKVKLTVVEDEAPVKDEASEQALPADLVARMEARGLGAALILDLARAGGYADLRALAARHRLTERRALSLWHEIRRAVA